MVHSLSNKDNGTSITSASGDIIEITLSDIPGSGYVWKVDVLEGPVSLLDKTSVNSTNERTGGSTNRTFSFECKSRGTACIRLHRIRPWLGPDDTSENFVIQIEIL